MASDTNGGSRLSLDADPIKLNKKPDPLQETKVDLVACSICLENVVDGGERSTAKLTCGHQFHLDCIGTAFNAKGCMQCPNCRQVEDGEWVYAGGYHPAMDEFSFDDYLTEDDYDYTFVEANPVEESARASADVVFEETDQRNGFVEISFLNNRPPIRLMLQPRDQAAASDIHNSQPNAEQQQPHYQPRQTPGAMHQIPDRTMEDYQMMHEHNWQMYMQSLSQCPMYSMYPSYPSGNYHQGSIPHAANPAAYYNNPPYPYAPGYTSTSLSDHFAQASLSSTPLNPVVSGTSNGEGSSSHLPYNTLPGSEPSPYLGFPGTQPYWPVYAHRPYMGHWPDQSARPSWSNRGPSAQSSLDHNRWAGRDHRPALHMSVHAPPFHSVNEWRQSELGGSGGRSRASVLSSRGTGLAQSRGVRHDNGPSSGRPYSRYVDPFAGVLPRDHLGLTTAGLSPGNSEVTSISRPASPGDLPGKRDGGMDSTQPNYQFGPVIGPSSSAHVQTAQLHFCVPGLSSSHLSLSRGRAEHVEGTVPRPPIARNGSDPSAGVPGTAAL